MDRDPIDIPSAVQSGEIEATFLNLEYFFNRVFDFFRVIGDFFYYLFGGSTNSGGTAGERFADSFGGFLTFLEVLLTLVTILLLAGIIYAYIRLRELEKVDEENYAIMAARIDDEPRKNVRWEEVLRLVSSPESGNWKLSIIEADTMLDEMTESMGYDTPNLGDRLKLIEPSDFTTLNEAWEAHKVRNRIAHEGSQFELTQKEAYRIVGLYEKVFKEFSII